MKVLIVQYLPGGERSKTKKLLGTAVSVLATKKVDVKVLDLLKDVPDFFMPEQLGVYYERNYGGQQVSPERMKSMAKMDRMTAQLKAADYLILATPMHNFSLPGIVKAWFDSVMQKGQTWDMGPGGFTGLMKGKKALLLMTSGGQYEVGNPYEHCMSLAKVDLGFMGFETEVVTAGGLNQFPDKADEVIAQAKDKVKEILSKYFV